MIKRFFKRNEFFSPSTCRRHRINVRMDATITLVFAMLNSFKFRRRKKQAISVKVNHSFHRRTDSQPEGLIA